jgi:hypothetical protein
MDYMDNGQVIATRTIAGTMLDVRGPGQSVGSRIYDDNPSRRSLLDVLCDLAMVVQRQQERIAQLEEVIRRGEHQEDAL